MSTYLFVSSARWGRLLVRWCVVVCVSVSFDRELCKNSWTNRDAIWDVDSGTGNSRSRPRSPTGTGSVGDMYPTCFGAVEVGATNSVHRSCHATAMQAVTGITLATCRWHVDDCKSCWCATQPCIPPGSLNRVPASAGVRAGMSPLPGGR